MTNCASDAGELEPALANIDPSIGTPNAALADNGYVNGDAIERLQSPKSEGGQDLDIYIPVTSEDGNNLRRYDFRPPKDRKLYSKRKQTVEPVFGIIKSVLGFRVFHLRGLEKVSIEWLLVALSYNVKRLYALRSVTMS